jgi:hypothetical protein
MPAENTPVHHKSANEQKSQINKSKGLTAAAGAAWPSLPGVTVAPVNRVSNRINAYIISLGKEKIEGGVERGDAVQLLVMTPQGGYPVTVDGRVLRVYKTTAQIYIKYRRYKPLIEHAKASGGFFYVIKAVKIPKIAEAGGV